MLLNRKPNNGGSTAQATRTPEPRPDVFVDRLLAEVTLPRVIVRAAECVILAQIDFPRPVLDVGSGDGTFAAALFDQPLEFGIDPWREQLEYSRRFNIYENLALASGDRLPFADASFATVMSNSTLEHISNAPDVLKEMYRVARPGAVCIVTVPSEHFPKYLLGSSVFRAARLGPLARLYEGFFNRISRHIHIQPPEAWRAWIEDAGFQIEDWRYYYSRKDTIALEVAHYVSVPSLITKAVLKRWVLWPGKRKYLPYRQVLSRFAKPGPANEGAYIFFRARKPD